MTEFIPADEVSLFIFRMFCALMFLVWFFAVKKSAPKKLNLFLLSFSAYIIVFSFVVRSEFLQEHVMPVVPLLFLSVFVGATWFAFSSFGTQIGMTFSLAVLGGVQVFRLPLELLLHHWANLGTVPPTMTWTGENWDIVSGLLAFVAIPLATRNRKAFIFIQGLSFLLLLNVIRVVIMSSPLPFAWPMVNPMRLIMYFPYALIAPLFVGTAWACHLIVFRTLFHLKSGKITPA